jgi:hypothetical protein
LEGVRERLPVLDEPKEVKAETRALLEETPEEGSRVIADAAFVSDLLWEHWGTDLEAAGMGYGRFLVMLPSYTG